jgi:hypothetical protein
MSRTVGGITLLALVIALPFVGITLVHCASGQTIAALDVCSTHPQAAPSDLSTLAEPFFELHEFQVPAGFPGTLRYAHEYIISSQVDKPPQA